MTAVKIRPVLLSLGAMLALYLLLTVVHMLGAAHAATDPPAPSVGLDLTGIAAIIGALAAGVFLILSGVSLLLHKIAPLTKTTLDDRALVTVDHLRDFAQEIRDMIEGKPEPNKPSGITGVVTLCVLLMLGVGLTSSCATVQPIAGQVVSAELDCTSGALVDTVKSLGNAAQFYLVGKVAGDGRTVDTTAIKDDLKALSSKAWSCALSVALQAVLGKTSLSITHAVGPRPDWSSVLVEVKGGLGVTQILLPDGSKL